MGNIFTIEEPNIEKEKQIESDSNSEDESNSNLEDESNSNLEDESNSDLEVEPDFNKLIQNKYNEKNINNNFFEIIKQLLELNILSLFIQNTEGTGLRIDYNHHLSAINLCRSEFDNCTAYLLYNYIVSGKFVLLSFPSHTIGILVNISNIRECKMIYNSTLINDNFKSPEMLFNKTPIVDLSEYSQDLNVVRITSIFDDMLKLKYTIYNLHPKEKDFLKAVGFNYEIYKFK